MVYWGMCKSINELPSLLIGSKIFENIMRTVEITG